MNLALVAQLAPLVMGSQLGERFAGVETQVGFYDSGALEFTSVNVDLVAEVPVVERITLAGRFPICWYQAGDDAETGIGNLTLAARSRIVDRRGPNGRIIVGGTASLSIPTADGTAPRIAATVHTPPHEWGHYHPDVTTLRLGGDFVMVRRRWFFQAQIAMHMMFFDESGGIVWNDDQVNLARLGLAAGVLVTPGLALVGEASATVGLLEGSDDDELLEGVDVGARWTIGRVTLAGRVWFPLDDEPREHGVLGFGLDVHTRL
jgi:hypothetical protein